MDLPELIILDVGHGNCAVLRDTEAVTIIDCPPGTTLIETLEALGIETVNHILISHADVDHVGGLPNLLENVNVRNIYLNPDADKKGKGKGGRWREVRKALELAQETGTQIHPSLTSVLSKKITSGQVQIEILAPSPAVALGGSGGEDLMGRRLTSNAMSVVIALMHKSHRVALLPGDMDEVGMKNLLERHNDVRAQILVFPHHGGSPGNANGGEFAERLCSLVEPHLVLFSLDRESNYPRDDVMRGVLSAVPNVHIMCTQLSKKCSVACPKSDFSHLTNLPAKGRMDDNCCGGTISIKIDGDQTNYKPSLSAHVDFVTNKANTAMCLNKFINIKMSAKP
jgi:beta-lactamase superfamily II metal-dependent hydrolase